MSDEPVPVRRPALSPSRASDFKQCPLLYRFRAIDRLPEPASTAQVRGSVVHAALEQLYALPAAERGPAAAMTLVDPAWERIVAAQPELAAEIEPALRAELLEGGVHDRPAYLRGGRRFRQPVDRAEPVQQRALLEVAGPRRRQCRTPDMRGRFVAHESQRMTTVRQPRAAVPARLLAG